MSNYIEQLKQETKARQQVFRDDLEKEKARKEFI